MNIEDNYTRAIHSIEGIHDGDTVTALVEVGFNSISRVTFRLESINTAEIRKGQSDERMQLSTDAKSHVESRLRDHPVRVVSKKFKSGGFGRYLGVLYYQDGKEWVNLNQEMLDLGLAQKYYLGASKDFGEFIK